MEFLVYGIYVELYAEIADTGSLFMRQIRAIDIKFAYPQPFFESSTQCACQAPFPVDLSTTTFH
jgi:hypothetical protein